MKKFLAVLFVGLFAFQSAAFAAWPSAGARTKEWSASDILTEPDLEGQFDVIWTYINDFLSGTSGHAHTGSTSQGPKLSALASLTFGASQALGDLIYASSSSAIARVAGNTTTTKKFLTQTGDGSASAAPTWSTIASTDLPAGFVVQVASTQSGAVSTGTTLVPWDDTIPQSGEGDQYMTLAITPTSATNKLRIDVTIVVAHTDNASTMTVGLFQDSTGDALAAVSQSAVYGAASKPSTISFTHYMTSGTTSSTTFKVRAGSDTAGTTTFNGSAGARKLGGVQASSITITEIKV